MKYLLLSILLLCTALHLSAQRSVVSADRMNVFYVGIPNPITVSAENYDAKDLTIVVTGATVSLSSEGIGKFEVMVDKPGAVNVEVRVKDGAGSKKIGEHQFRAKYIPDPVAVLAMQSSGTMKVSVAKAQIGVIAVLSNFDFDCQYKITRFQTEVFQHGKLAFSNKNEGARFDERTKEFFEGLQAGDKLIISGIYTVGPDKRERELTNIYLTLE